MASPLKAYLAGPDVFKPNSDEIANQKRAVLLGKNIMGIYPTDNDESLKRISDLKELAAKIYEINDDMIKGCDVVLANITPFRGPSVDVGTAIEMATGKALGKLVVGYYEGAVEPYAERVKRHCGGETSQGEGGRAYASDGASIEGFGLEDNLMVPGTVRSSGGEIFSSFEEAASNIQRLWEQKQAQASQMS